VERLAPYQKTGVSAKRQLQIRLQSNYFCNRLNIIAGKSYTVNTVLHYAQSCNKIINIMCSVPEHYIHSLYLNDYPAPCCVAPHVLCPPPYILLTYNKSIKYIYLPISFRPFTLLFDRRLAYSHARSNIVQYSIVLCRYKANIMHKTI
jgi:hypothetical protein